MSRFLSFLIFISCSLSGFAQLPVSLTDALDKTLDSMRIVLNNKSLSASIAFPDGAWAKAKGINSGFPSTQVTTSDAYLIGSVTKPITALVMLQLVDEGKLGLDDSLHQYLDTFPNINPNITIRQLLQHRSGIYDILNNPAFNQAMNQNPMKSWKAAEIIETYSLPPNAAPGGAWDYCNPNFWLLGMIAEEIEGKPFHQIYRERLFDPHGLASFTLPAFEQVNVPVAHAWFDLNADGVLDDAHQWYMNNKALNSAAGAAGGYFATPTDLAKLMRLYQRGDLCSASSLAEAQTTIFAQGSQGNQYGLGLMKNTLGGALCYGHGGDLVYSASSWYFPDCDIAISVLNNDGTMQGAQPKFSSWKLLPVVASLYKTAKTYCATSAQPEVESDTPSEALAIWPNPATGTEIQFEAARHIHLDGAQATWQNSLGQIVATTTLTIGADNHRATVTIPAQLNRGIYLLTLLTWDGELMSRKLVIE